MILIFFVNENEAINDCNLGYISSMSKQYSLGEFSAMENWVIVVYFRKDLYSSKEE